MPTPKLFKKFSSKSNASESSPAPDVPTNDEKIDFPQPVVVTADGPVPGYSDSLKEAWTAANKELPQAKGAEKFLNKIENVENSLTLTPGEQTVVDTLAVPAKALMNTPHIAENIEKGVNAFMEAVPSLMKALDEVAKIHPFISVAVLAFKAVYTLETKRRENDKRVLALYVEMKDMMAVLVQLKDVSDPKQIAPDGQTIEGRLQNLCESVAEDIKKCANACDTYLKKKVLVKIFAGPIWEGRLLEFVGIFTKRREEFEFSLTIHTTVGVDAANLKLDAVNERTAELAQRMDVMLQLFHEFITPEQKKLTVMVEERGGVAALENEYAMKELAEAEFFFAAPSGSDSRHGTGRPSDVAELQHEIKGDPDEAIEKNAEFFNRKFDIQRRQIVEDIARAVNREGDRIISAVTAGPHDRIVDPDIYNIWKDMGWRGSVKARHFVMLLKDYFVEKTSGETGTLKGPDSWAIGYINIGRARSILEAFDDDASGYVTVSEVNILTRLRPRDWSLPHWIAYWAMGWHMTCTTYCEKIEEIFDAMIRLASDALPENRREVNKYIARVWTNTVVFVQSVKREKGTEELRSKFEPYVTAEEARLQRNFEDIKYDIDTYDTVQLIAGEGRAEMTLLPMIYLALKRDLERINLARKHVLSDFELYDAYDTILYITDTAWNRIASLRTIFGQQNLEANEQFELFANGLYNIGHLYGARFHGDKLRELPDPTPCRDEIIPDPDSIPLSILNHPLGKKHEIDFAAYDPPEITPSPAEGVDPVLGVYYGFIYEDGKPMDPMIKFTFDKGEGENTFIAAGVHYRSGTHKNYKITGKWSPPSEDGKIPVELKIVYATTYFDVELTGVFDPEENSLRGTMLIPTDGATGEFVFKRDPDFVRFYPAPSITNAGKRWEFATTSVLDRIRRKAWSPMYILNRIKGGKRYMELSLRLKDYGRDLSTDEVAEFLALFPVLYEADTRFYASLINIDLSRIPIFTTTCDNCGSTPGGSRIICMDCRSQLTTVDFCSEPECINCTVVFTAAERKPHSPNHGMFKVHRIIFDRDIGRIEKTAQEALDSVQGTLSELAEGEEPMPECVHCTTAISLPCWCCVECTEKRFICDDCEHDGLAFNETHTKMHTLVRVSKKVEEKELSVEERLRLVEDELTKMGELLAQLVKKSTEGSPSDPLTKGDIQAAVIEAESARPEEEAETAEAVEIEAESAQPEEGAETAEDV